MSAKRVRDQCYRQPRDSIIMPSAYVRADWDELTDEEKQQILDKEEQEQDDDEDD